MDTSYTFKEPKVNHHSEFRLMVSQMCMPDPFPKYIIMHSEHVNTVIVVISKESVLNDPLEISK